ncbi:MAG: hypothetical protein Q8P46_09890 [Hyphomicrobiales bacterium]|nr:hypothetical protein [Hyphomicrobiales bacterium]
MPDDHADIELIRGLFAAATEILEDAHEAVVQGQTPDRVLEECQAMKQRSTRPPTS